MPATFADPQPHVETCRREFPQNAQKEALPFGAPDEYRFLYVPTMLSVYTARHLQMPQSPEALRLHVFGSADHAGCDACREETEFLVAHQKQFF